MKIRLTLPRRVISVEEGPNVLRATVSRRRIVNISIATGGGGSGPALPFPTNQILTVASTVLSGHIAVKVTSAGAASVSSSVVADAGDGVGITTGAASAGGSVTVQTFGPITEPSWAWIPGAKVFIGAGGLLTQTPPSLGSGDAFSQVIGTAETPTRLFVRVEPPIIL